MRVKSAFLIWFGAALCATAQMPNTPLLNAVVQNDTAAAEKLLAEGADPNEGRFAGIPPIFFVVMHQNTRLFHAMKAKGADIKVKDKTGSNLLMWAAADDSGRGELVEELLRLGLDPSDTDSKGDNALTWALRRGSDTPAVRALRKGRSFERADDRAGSGEGDRPLAEERTTVHQGIGLRIVSPPGFAPDGQRDCPDARNSDRRRSFATASQGCDRHVQPPARGDDARCRQVPRCADIGKLCALGTCGRGICGGRNHGCNGPPDRVAAACGWQFPDDSRQASLRKQRFHGDFLKPAGAATIRRNGTRENPTCRHMAARGRAADHGGSRRCNCSA